MTTQTKTETNNTESPRLYVGTYHKYNSGSISGAWLNLDDYDDSLEFYGACNKLHCDESNPEFMFQDFENFPSSLYSESGGIDAIYEYLEFINRTYVDQEVIEAGMELDIPLESIEEVYQGQYDDDEDFAFQLAENCGYIDHKAVWPMGYINWEHAARDLMYDYSKVDNHYFATS